MRSADLRLPLDGRYFENRCDRRFPELCLYRFRPWRSICRSAFGTSIGGGNWAIWNTNPIRRIQDADVESKSQFPQNVLGGRQIAPAIAGDLRDVLTNGVIPRFYGFLLEYLGKRGIPHQLQQAVEIDAMLWELIRQRKDSICSRSKMKDGKRFPHTPIGLLGRKNPDQTLKWGRY